MTDEAIFELTPETSMTAAARFIVQEVAETTRATSATFALMGGLELNTTYDTASDHSNITAEVGKMYAINISAVTTDNLQFDLPDTAKVGERVGVYITTGDDTYELEVRTAAAGSTLNGSDLSASSTKWRLFISHEILICRCIVAGGAGATEWIVEYDGRIPCKTYLYGGTDITTHNADQAYDVPLTTAGINIGNCGDTTNGYIVARRNEKWVLSGTVYQKNTQSSGMYQGSILINGSFRGRNRISPGTDTTHGVNIATMYSVNNGQIAKLQFECSVANIGVYKAASNLTGAEVLP